MRAKNVKMVAEIVAESISMMKHIATTESQDYTTTKKLERVTYWYKSANDTMMGLHTYGQINGTQRDKAHAELFDVYFDLIQPLELQLALAN